MGDIVHALPAVASLKTGFPGAHLTWVVEPRWASMLEANPFVDRVILLRRRDAAGLVQSWRELRSERFDLAVDFQGLIKSAVVAAIARPERIFGWDSEQLRERAAGIFYSHRASSAAAHVVDRNLDLAAAAGAHDALRVFPLPAGRPEAPLPEGAFVLASPAAGWRAKQWPIENYLALGRLLRRELNLALVLNGPPGSQLETADGIWPHACGLPGLLDATRRAAAVVGVDSGPMHLAAALAKPGVALFGPTDPARNGPYGGSLGVLRWAGAATTYKRLDAIDESMRRIAPEEVFESLRAALGRARGNPVCGPT
jgi:heptosyltransferase-1